MNIFVYSLYIKIIVYFSLIDFIILFLFYPIISLYLLLYYWQTTLAGVTFAEVVEIAPTGPSNSPIGFDILLGVDIPRKMRPCLTDIAANWE